MNVLLRVFLSQLTQVNVLPERIRSWLDTLLSFINEELALAKTLDEIKVNG